MTTVPSVLASGTGRGNVERPDASAWVFALGEAAGTDALTWLPAMPDARWTTLAGAFAAPDLPASLLGLPVVCFDDCPAEWVELDAANPKVGLDVNGLSSSGQHFCCDIMGQEVKKSTGPRLHGAPPRGEIKPQILAPRPL